MPSDISKFTLRTDSELLKKFRVVADFHARSANREIEVLMKKHVNSSLSPALMFHGLLY